MELTYASWTHAHTVKDTGQYSMAEWGYFSVAKLTESLWASVQICNPFLHILSHHAIYSRTNNELY